ncbi:MAG: dTDP-4-dehydrorhamnose reductase [Candidatus Doudnabacteria bacterium]|nr:dTDP-4-dehydrorhamnose reductase [Candidatus Doudnabacteria bacterium]
MSKILILGYLGGLGQAFMEVYEDEKPIGLDREDFDIANESQVLEIIQKHQPSLVINCTGYTAVDKAEVEREFAESINGSGPGFVAAACKEVGATLVHFSTGMVFDGNNSEGYNEDALTNPINTYGRTKLLGEIEVQKRMDNFYIIRSAWLFGKTKTGKKSFIDIMLEKAQTGEVIKAVTDEVGCPTYDFDLAQATRALIEVKKPFGLYHITNSGRANRFDWAEEIFRIKEIEADVVGVPASDFPKRAALRPKFEVLNNTKFILLRPWQEALEEFLGSNY